MNMTAGKYSTHDVITAGPDCSILEAARLMREHHVGSLIIVEEEKDGARPVGIVTDRDLVIEVLAEEVPSASVTVKDIMTNTLIIAREEDDIITVLKRMEERGVRRIPITNIYNELTGMLTADDVLKVFYNGLGKVISIYNREIAREKKARN